MSSLHIAKHGDYTVILFFKVLVDRPPVLILVARRIMTDHGTNGRLGTFRDEAVIVRQEDWDEARVETASRLLGLSHRGLVSTVSEWRGAWFEHVAQTLFARETDPGKSWQPLSRIRGAAPQRLINERGFA